MSRDTVLRGIVHFYGAYLNLKRNALFADNCRMQRLITVRLRGGDIVLEAVRHGAEQVVNNAEYIITFDDRLNDDPHGVNVIDLIERLVLDVHLLVNAEYRLYSALNDRLGLDIADALSDTLDYRIDKAVALVLVNIQQPLYFLAAVRVKVMNGNTFHFLLDVAHT